MKNDTGELLGTQSPSAALASAVFDSGKHPLTFREAQWAGTTWLRWLRDNEYIKRRIALAGEPVRYDILQPIPRASIVTLDLVTIDARDVGASPNDMRVKSWV